MSGQSPDATKIKMRHFLVHFQPNRAGALSVPSVKALLSEFAARNPKIVGFAFADGLDRGPYVNFTLSCRAGDVPAVWNALSRRVFANPRLGRKLKRSCITTCEGTRSWDNYLLLQHFDEDVHLDRVPGP
jgi:hypothetical protein